MHRLSTCHRDRRVTDTVPQTRAQISDIRRARADSVRSLKHAGTCTLPPQGHGWATLPPRGTATCKMGVHRLPKSGSSHNRTHPQPRTCTQCRSLETWPCHPAKLPSPPTAPPVDTRPARAATVAGFCAPWIGTMTSRRVKRPSRWSSYIDASVTTASGVDLWTRQSVSARSRAYARLTWAVRGSIARSPNGFSPLPHAPSRIHWQLIETLSHRAELRARVQTVHNCECAEASRKTLRVRCCLHANAVTSASIQLNERMETIVGKIREDPMVKGCSCRSAQRSLTRCEAARQHPLKGRTANGVPPAASRYPPATLLSEIFGQTRIRSIEVKRRNINQGGSALVFSTP